MLNIKFISFILINLLSGFLCNPIDQPLNLDIKIICCNQNEKLDLNDTQIEDLFEKKYMKPIVKHYTQSCTFDIYEYLKDKNVTADDIIYVKQLKSFHEKVFGLQVLTTLLKKSGQESELLKLAFKIEKFIRNENIVSEEDKALVQYLLDMFPDTYRKMAFGNVCLFCLGCYLVTEMNESSFAAPNSEQRAFCLKTNSRPKDGAIWKFETKNDGESFHLKNVNRGEYLYAMDENFTFNDKYRKVHVSEELLSGLNYEWQVDITNDEISIKNRRYRENVLTWTTGVVSGGKQAVLVIKGINSWQIEAC